MFDHLPNLAWKDYHAVYGIRADVAGRADGLVSYGSSGIVDPDGMALQSAQQLDADLIVAELKTSPRKQRRGWDAARNSAVMDEYARPVTGTHTGRWGGSNRA